MGRRSTKIVGTVILMLETNCYTRRWIKLALMKVNIVTWYLRMNQIPTREYWIKQVWDWILLCLIWDSEIESNHPFGTYQ